jgi:hypothetical protein
MLFSVTSAASDLVPFLLTIFQYSPSFTGNASSTDAPQSTHGFISSNVYITRHLCMLLFDPLPIKITHIHTHTHTYIYIILFIYVVYGVCMCVCVCLCVCVCMLLIP